MIVARTWVPVVLVSLLGPTITPTAWGQNDRVPAADSEGRPGWEFTFTPNAWASGVKGTVGDGSQLTEVDLSFSDIFDSFDLGVMGLFEARRTPWVVRADLFYVSLADDRATGSGSSTVPVNQEDVMAQPELGYTVLSRSWGTVDLLGGARYWHLSVDIGPTNQAVSSDRSWLDGTVGAGLRYRPADRWTLFAKSDLGLGGSDFTWQALGGAGYNLGRCCTADAMYRYLAVDYRPEDGFVYDVHLSGPALGLTLHF